MEPFTCSLQQCKQKHTCTMLWKLRAELASQRAMNARADGHVLGLQEGGLFAEPVLERLWRLGPF